MPPIKKTNNGVAIAAPAAIKKPVLAKPGAKPAEAPVLSLRPLVKCGPKVDKSGCGWCPLMPFALDFDRFKAGYQRDATKILAKEKEGHLIRNRNVREEWTEVDILFVGEAPGADEDKQGLPFVGRAGKLLRDAIKEMVEVPPERIGFTSLVRCRPPRNREPNGTEKVSCAPELVREIAARKPKVIVAMGNHGLEFLTGQSGITTMCGKVLRTIREDVAKLPVVGCLNPLYVLRMDHEMEKFLKAIGLASDVALGKYEAPHGMGTYKVLTELSDVRKMFEKFRKDKRVTTFDTETGALTPFQSKFPALLCFSFSNGEFTGYTVPYDHPDSPWRVGGPKAKERPALTKLLVDYFIDPKIEKVAQNEKFDRQHIRAALGVEPVRVVRDTMITHLVTDETRGTHGLKILSYSFTGMGGYERPLEHYIETHREADPEAGGSYANIPGDVLFPYAAMDADVTWRTDEGLQKIPEYANNKKLQNIATFYLPELSRVLADMEYEGAKINKEVAKKLDVKYSGEMKKKTQDISNDPCVKKFVDDRRRKLVNELPAPKFYKNGKPRPPTKAFQEAHNFEFNPGSTDQLREVLFDYYDLKPVEMTDTGFEKLVARHKRLNDEAKADGKEGPNFSNVVNAAIEKREWEFFTTKADVLHEYERQKNPLANHILQYRDAQVMHGTFVTPLLHKLDPLDKIHGTFLIHGTVTGRLSSADPNLQNIPNKGGGLIKQAYVSRFGDEGVLLNVDFSQIELRVAAAYYREPTMIQAYLDNADLHTLTAADIAFPALAPAARLAAFKKLPKDEQKQWRTRAKRVNFGVLYGGGPPALQTTLKKDGVFVTVEECQKLIDLYFKARPALKKGIEKLEEKVRRTGYLESFTGRRRRIPEVFSEDEQLVARALRQSVNFPIQSGAGDMTLMALILIHRVLKAEGFKSRVILTVHDSLVFDCHVDELFEVARLAKEVMENIPSLSDEVLPGLDWSWLHPVPIVAECEAGPSWGQMVEFDPTTIETGLTDDAPLIGLNDKQKEDLLRKPVNVDELWEAFAFKLKKAV